MQLEEVKKLTNAKGIAISDNYLVYLTGQKVYVLDSNNLSEIACFTGLKYAYKAVISPDEKLLVVKSTEPKLWFYSLDSYSLIKKITLRGNKQPQDHGICFSGNGNYIYNIVLDNNILSFIQKYDAKTLELKETYFEKNNYFLSDIQYIRSKDLYFIYGYERIYENNEDIECRHFLMWFNGKDIGKLIYTEQDTICGCFYN